jgi:hypothetical protein
MAALGPEAAMGPYIGLRQPPILKKSDDVRRECDRTLDKVDG